MIRQAALFALLLLPFVLPTNGEASRTPDAIVFDPAVMAETKERVLRRDPALMPAFRRLIAEADKAIVADAESVIFKPTPPPRGDRHDYWSLAPYWWPDPDQPRGLPYVRRDGERNPKADADAYDHGRLNRMAHDVLTLSLAWFLTENEMYAGKATALVWAWCCDSFTRMNPRLDFAHFRPGISPGTSTGVLDAVPLVWVCEAARILQPSRSWSDVVTHKTQAWFKEYCQWLLDSELGRGAAARADRVGVWRDAQLVVFALYSGDMKLARTVAETAHQRIESQIERNGSLPQELRRARSRHATFSTLQAFFVLAAASERLGIDLWRWGDVHGGSIKRALDFAAPHFNPARPWPFGDVGQYDPMRFTALFYRAALVYSDDQYRKTLGFLSRHQLETDPHQLFY